jgi:hypothetical protein
MSDHQSARQEAEDAYLKVFKVSGCPASTMQMLSEQLMHVFTPMELPAPGLGRQKRQRKPRLDRLIKQAEQTGKSVNSITTPDGHVLHFGEAETTAAGNPWLTDLKVVKK